MNSNFLSNLYKEKRTIYSQIIDNRNINKKNDSEIIKMISISNILNMIRDSIRKKLVKTDKKSKGGNNPTIRTLKYRCLLLAFTVLNIL